MAGSNATQNKYYLIIKSMEQQTTKKNYRVIFWNLFGISLLLGIANQGLKEIKGVDISNYLFIGAIIVYIIWGYYLNEAWKAIGKKFGWSLTLINFIPFGSLGVIAIAHHYLKGTDYWKGEYKSFKLQK